MSKTAAHRDNTREEISKIEFGTRFFSRVVQFEVEALRLDGGGIGDAVLRVAGAALSALGGRRRVGVGWRRSGRFVFVFFGRRRRRQRRQGYPFRGRGRCLTHLNGALGFLGRRRRNNNKALGQRSTNTGS